MAEQSVLRVGVVGCGWHGRSLAEAVVRSSSLQLTACADPNEAAASRAAALAANVSTHRSIEALLAERDVDAVVIATPHHILGPASRIALRAGKHVLVEKPAALNAREAAEIEQAASEAGVCYMTGYSFRYSMSRYVQELLQQGTVGTVRAISGAIGMGPANEGWTAYPETGGGPMLFVGCHLVDSILWFVGDDPTQVYADVQLRADTGVDNTSAFQIGFAGGVFAQCLVTQDAPSFFYQIDIYGSAGKIALRGRNFLQFEIEVVSTAVPAYAELTVIRPAVRRDHITMMLVPELEDFACAILNGRPPSIAASDARRVLRVLDAIRESGQSHQPVSLDSTVKRTPINS